MNQVEPESSLLTTSEVQKEFFPNLTRSRVVQLIRSGVIPSIRFSPRKIMVPRRGIEHMIDAAIAKTNQ